MAVLIKADNAPTTKSRAEKEKDGDVDADIEPEYDG